MGDVTYLRVAGQWRYLAAVMDKHSRRIMGWSLSPRRDVALTLTALRHAVRQSATRAWLCLPHRSRHRVRAPSSIRDELRRHGIVQSMNRPGKMNDNAHMESFFHSMKSEFLWGKQFDSDQELRQTLRSYMRTTTTRGCTPHSSTSRQLPSNDARPNNHVSTKAEQDPCPGVPGQAGELKR